MDTRTEAREFLQSRRAKLDPESTGVTVGGRRRVPGLRREEVADLAGVSVDYYTRLEKGHLETASAAVLDAIARALDLDDAERSHLQSLARAARGELDPGAPARERAGVRPRLQRLLDTMTTSPAYVRNGRMDILAHNALARWLYPPLFDCDDPTPNLARFCFTDPRARTFFADWSAAASEMVALLHAELVRHPTDRRTHDFVERLADASADFAGLWSTHDVRRLVTESTTFLHPEVGPITLDLEALQVSAEPDLTVVTYVAPFDSPTAARLHEVLAGASLLGLS
ncbi:hypothetical protein ASG49_00180 [Marmoricola sp. Leaf446]|uniref:helix-turn-helix domain-containing protein n=1 Tax=Marmoricola sp. Leaf446 TaxID=1736379 RepID=UPI0006FBDE3E|nr:helix-turn-helix transcriptional regulator [Marmoricola sp. Leaf446]KQT93482.1 hypothetical protein ASG49_00180 [Marmoricola sp. Leaf446]